MDEENEMSEFFDKINYKNNDSILTVISPSSIGLKKKVVPKDIIK
jgi:hypothetical protein